MTTPARIDTPLDRKTLNEMEVSKFAGLTFQSYQDAIDFSKVVTHAKYGLPGFLKNNAADCLIIVTQALRWRLEPVWVMQHAYVTKQDGIFAYDSFVFGAILNASGLLRGRPRYTYTGQGEQRICTISATFRDEAEPHSYSTPPLKVCRKNSPLWVADPDQQLAYFAVRSFARRYIPELLGGVYTRDEFEETTQEAPRPAKSMRSVKDGLDDLVSKSRAEQLKEAGLSDDEVDEALEDMGEYADSDDESVPEKNVPKDNKE